MSEFDAFAGQLLEESKRFLEKAAGSNDQIAKDAYLHASLMIALSALEARVNSIAEEQIRRTDLSTHEKGFLSERDVLLKNGEFKIADTLKMWRLDERVEFLCVRTSGHPLDKASWWGQMREAIRLRNDLTHPKTVPGITESSVTKALEAVIAAFDALSKAVYGRGFPAAKKGLTSKLQF